MYYYALESVLKETDKVVNYELIKNDLDYFISWFEGDIKWKFNDFQNEHKEYIDLLLSDLRLTEFISSDKYLEIDEMKNIIPQIDELLQEKDIKKDLEMYSILIEIRTYLKCAIAFKQRVFIFSE